MPKKNSKLSKLSTQFLSRYAIASDNRSMK